MAATEKDPKQIELAHSLANVPWCEEYEKMISGMLYNPFGPELTNARFQARKWAHDYKSIFPSSNEALEAERYAQLKSIIGKLGKDVFIEPPFQMDYGCNIVFGDRVYANFNLTILDCAIVSIGDGTMMGPNVSIFAATHETEVQSRRDGIEYARAVTIGKDCWIGGHAVILPGVTIGDGCTIGAASVVTKDIPPWSVAIGSPARVVKKVKPLDNQGDATKTQQS